MNVLGQTGTSTLLHQLSGFVEDAYVNELLPKPSGPGRPRSFSSAQLLRVLLLGLLTPAHSYNLLLKLLPENRSWRRFAQLPNLRILPDAKMLHEFRSRLGLYTLRQINAQLLMPLLNQLDPNRQSLAIMDATDLPAAVNGFKKRPALFRRNMQLLERAVLKRAAVDGLSVTKSTVCGCGCHSMSRVSCSCR